MRRQLLGFVASAAGALVLGGCGAQSADPPPLANTPPSGTPSPTATLPTVPPLPPAAKENSKAGAVAFVKYYVTAFNHAQATGDVKPLRALGAIGCTSCRRITRSIERIYRSGGKATGGRWVIEGHDVHRGVKNQWAVYLSSHFEPATTVPSRGASPHHNKGGPLVASFFVRYQRGWEVVQWTRAQ